MKKIIILLLLLLPETIYSLNIYQQKLIDNLEKGTIEQITEILQNVPDVNFTDSKNRTPLIYAAAYRNNPVVSLLLSKGAKVNVGGDRGKTALIYAAKNSNDTAELINILLAASANINQPDNNKWTPLMHAARTGHVNNVKKLIELKADETLQDDKGNTALMHAIIGADEKTAEMYKEHIRLLSQNQNVIDLKNKEQLTAAELAKKFNLTKLWNEVSPYPDYSWDDFDW